MLNRKILRIKAFKVIYAHAVTGTLTQDEAVSELIRSCEATRDLYLLMLALVGPLTSEARRRIDAAKGKFNPTEEDLNPNEKFADNALAGVLAADPDFNKLIDRKKLSWARYEPFVQRLLDIVSEKDYFKEYMASETKSLKEDCALFTKIYEEEFVDNEDIYPILEEQSLYWYDDLAYALTWCCHTLEDLARGRQWRLPELYQSDEVRRRKNVTDMESDADFVKKLVKAALAGYERYFAKVTEMAPDWDSDRLFSSDMAIIACAMAEVESLGTPPKIVLNEYIEIAKHYCAAKSCGFINGVLDRLIKETNVNI